MRPVDKLLAGYLTFLTIVIFGRGVFGDPANWALLGMHVLFGVLLYLFARLEPRHRVGQFLHDLYPLLLLPAFYAELGILSLQLGMESTYARDAVVQRWENVLFGGQVSFEWIRRSPSVFWSGVLHLAYFTYFPLVLLGPLLLIARRRRGSARQVLLATMAAFIACYLVFVLYPVAGPYYAFEQPRGPVRDVWSARLVYWILNGGSSFGAAFPSSHVAATVSAILALWHEWRGFAAAFVVPAGLLVIGTVYCQMHYGVDALAGVIVGTGAWWVASRFEA